EGGLAWNLGRELTTRRFFQKKYKINYDKVIAYEHKWSFKQIVEKIKLSRLFLINRTRYFPFLLPSAHLNIIGCLECVKLEAA
ncbi:MAG: hypothetical protein N3D16_12290, partial [Anaerolineales bacterium]|nr:hypothetical protein [Anaerolineales bacterium]